MDGTNVTAEVRDVPAKLEKLYLDSKGEQVWEEIHSSKTLVLVGAAVAATALLLALLLYDVCKARKNRNQWVPTGALVLNALCLTLLGLLPRPVETIIDDHSDEVGSASPPLPYQIEKEYDFASSFEAYEIEAWYACSLGVIVLGQRVMMCVFMGYLLPTMGNIGKVFSGDMLALVISLGSTFYQAFMELYAQWLFFNKLDTVWLYRLRIDQNDTVRRTAIQNILIMLSMMYLWGLLFCAMLASIAIQDIGNLKLRRLIRTTAVNVANSPRFANWQQWRRQMLGLCIMCRSFQPSYLIARSVLASSIFFAVTISSSIYFSGVPQGISQLFSTYSIASPIIFLVWVSVQSLFIICGWCVICQRWMQSVIFCSKVLNHEHSSLFPQLCHFFKIENFWVRAAKEIQHNCQIQILADDKGFRLLSKMLTALKLHKLFIVGLRFQFIMVWCSKLCCLFSKLLLYPNLVVRVSMGSQALREYRRFNQQLIPDQIEEFHAAKEYLLILDGESSLAVWVANLSFIDTIRRRLEESKAKGKECLEMKILFSKAQEADVHNNSCFIAERYVKPLLQGNVKIKFDLQYLSIKMIVVSLLAILFEVSAVYETVVLKLEEKGIQIENNVQDKRDNLGKCIKAVEQAWQIMSVSETLSMETKRLSNDADDVFKEIKETKCTFRWLNHDLPLAKTESVQVAVQNLKSMAEKEVEKSCHNDEFDCLNWNHAVAGAHLQSICNRILMDQVTDLEEIEQITGFLENLERLLASTVQHGVLKIFDCFHQFLEKCSDCSNLDESQIIKICSSMAMVLGILEG